GPAALAAFASAQAWAIGRRQRDRREADRHAEEMIGVVMRRQAVAELPQSLGRDRVELALAAGERVLGDVRRGLAEAELRLHRREAVIGLGRIEIELARPLARAGGAAEIAFERLVGAIELARMLGEDRIVIVDRAQIGRELALEG